jgi:hypothetical protein
MMEDDADQRPESLLPYEEWTQQALRHVVERALSHLAAQGLPGQHHFYLTFRTDHPGTMVPARLKAQYPQEMTIVLQHQFRDPTMQDGLFSVVLSFGGVPSTLVIPLAAITGFADPAVQFVLRFPPAQDAADEALEEAPDEPETDTPEASGEVSRPEGPQVVSLDAFRRRPPPKT